MKDRNLGFRTQALILISLLLLVANIVLGMIMMSQAKTALKTQIHDRMLDIARTAASMIDGDAYEKITQNNTEAKEYRTVYDTLSTFLNHTTVKYIYGIRKNDDGTFIFTIDPAPANAAVFGEAVQINDALLKAAEGTSAVTEEPYEDDYGKFYTAYCPIYNSSAKIVGFVAADCDAEWYDNQISRVGFTILACCIISLLVGAVIVLMATSRLRRRFRELNDEMRELAVDVNTFTRTVTGVAPLEEKPSDATDITISEMERRSYDEIRELGTQIRNMREDLQAHIDKVSALAYKDALTGVKSKLSYVEEESKLNLMIQEGAIHEFAVAAFDINGLKRMNDTRGHQAGDALICAASAMICEHYAHSPVFRTGGDEFAVVIKGRDFAERQKILDAFDQQVEQNLREGRVVVSAGMSDFIPGHDNTFQDVFDRADKKMYERKNILKSMGAVMRE